MDKSKVRQYLSDQRKRMTYKKRVNKSLSIIENLLPLLEGKKNIAIYLNTKEEVITLDYLDYFLQNFDVVSSSITEEDQLWFYQIKNKNELVPGFMQILEPAEEILVNKEDIEVIITPMLGFDKRCNRIGYGRGYYDKYLEDYKGEIIGLAFAEQEYPHLPTTDLDVRMDYVVTDRKVFKKQ